MKEERKKYERPSMRRSLVELEDGFCTVGSATIQNPNTDNGKINPHDVNTEFEADFSGGGWD